MTDPVKETLPEKEDNNVYNIVSIEKEPEFPGGQEALLKFVNSHINYPAQAQDMNVQGRVFIQFVVEKNGSISAVALNKSKIPGNDMGLIKEAIRVVNLIPPFKPGMQNGKPVRVNYILPINFKISSN